MGKIKLEGFVPKDDPMFFGGPALFSRPGSRQPYTTSAGSTVDPTLGASTLATPPPADVGEASMMESRNRQAKLSTSTAGTVRRDRKRST